MSGKESLRLNTIKTQRFTINNLFSLNFLTTTKRREFLFKILTHKMCFIYVGRAWFSFPEYFILVKQSTIKIILIILIKLEIQERFFLFQVCMYYFRALKYKKKNKLGTIR